MEKFPHQQFIEDNKIEISTLPTMLRKRIEGFNELQDDLQHTVEEDKEDLLSKLETLSHELAEDLEEQFEDELQNNDVEEDAEESSEETPVKTSEEIPLQEPLPGKEAETEDTDTSEQTLNEEEDPVEEQTDESLLEELHHGKMLLVLPAHLIEMGFKTPLIGKQVIVGKFILRKGKYDKRYTIALK